MDELLQKARKELEPPWDEVREARVLSQVLEAGHASRVQAARRKRVWLGGAAAVSIAAAAALAVWPRSTVSPSGTRAPLARSGPASAGGTTSTGSVLAFADGSQARLEVGAEVRALEQSRERVRLEQRRGVVRYEVTPNPARPFTVSIENVEVRVIGTIFTVAAEANGVRVEVERGRVAVSSGQRSVELAPGENVRLSFGEPPAHTPAEASSSRVALPIKSTALPSSSASAASLRDEADRARARGDLAEAERLLSRLIKEYGSSPQAVSATFSLGRIQSARGNFAAAAATFESLRRRSPSGPLAEDALAEAANAWAMAGRTAQARALAAEYESRYPGGPHAERMRRLRAP